MNGAESLVHTLLACGIDTCFANPGTSEMHFVAALDRVPGMRCVLGLFEGVVTGAADGYARMAEKPAATLLHCGPGLANGLANLHNGRRASTMMVNCVGDQATHHRPLDAPLTADTEGWARGVSGWVRSCARAEDVGRDAAAAVQAAFIAPGGISTLILPSDTCWNPGGMPAAPLPVPARPQADPHAIAEAARLLRRGEPSMLLLTTDALRAGPLADAHRIAAATGARLYAPTSNRRIERGAGRHPIDRVPYAIDLATQALAGIRHVILVGALSPPVGFFAYPGKPGVVTPSDATVHVLARPEQDLAGALAALADALDAPAAPPAPHRAQVEPAGGPVTADALARSLTALLPEQAIIIDESVSFGRSIFGATAQAAPHDWLALAGGAIGEGIPLATGAAVASPGRRVVTLQADGSAMYTIQGLWTQARENLDVTTIILANRKYAILLGELANVGANPGRTALDMMDLSRPDLDFVKIAAGMGVAGARAETMEQFNDLFAQTLSRRGPFVIELAIP
ncbi:putative acetolactate synthase large subunit IlvX [Rhodovastum atsumiense]|uniref:Acetolactate synthase large subunit n=1 Tax=Rhodovastum atsumiense TaxID=504468 RepID=A0A5M6IN92_9PROT|nr:acetolactate synthase large subunit [Rhodovastum atsumiense]KAA5609736.1 acetolactate synthase large subunit [Rhodovastum atsumiense]CAH2604508.1 putative acetolactate synthase large subunit IlvX [Rhodovastum atsumiense]